MTDENKRIAKIAALKSFVLLENKKNVLPLKKGARIALIGPFANNQREMFSSWVIAGDVRSVFSIYDGLKTKMPETIYAEGSQVNDDTLMIRKRGGSFDSLKQQRLIKEAVEAAQKSDVVVTVLGESSAMSGEARSRTDISIPHCQRELLKALKATGKPVILLLLNGRPLTIQDDLPYTDAVVEIWRPGTEAGNAIADLLSGEYNPSGKLTMTFPRSVGQIPIYYNHKNTGRAYLGKQEYVSSYMDQYNSPLYSFGYGLSYTTFKYGDVLLSDTLLRGSKTRLTAKINVTNSRNNAGEETVQLYLADPVASVTRPVEELKHFQKVFLKPGETRQLSFDITTEDLKFFNSSLKWDWEPGKFLIYIGGDSQTVKRAEFTWEKKKI